MEHSPKLEWGEGTGGGCKPGALGMAGRLERQQEELSCPVSRAERPLKPLVLIHSPTAVQRDQFGRTRDSCAMMVALCDRSPDELSQ